MAPIIFTKEELDIGIIQISCRLDCFNKELAESKDAARIKEIVVYLQPLESLLSKLKMARYS